VSSNNICNLTRSGHWSFLTLYVHTFRVFEYLTTKFVDVVNPRFDYNKETIPPPKDLKYDSAMMYDNETMIIGIPRLRQLRILPRQLRYYILHIPCLEITFLIQGIFVWLQMSAIFTRMWRNTTWAQHTTRWTRGRTQLGVKSIAPVDIQYIMRTTKPTIPFGNLSKIISGVGLVGIMMYGRIRPRIKPNRFNSEGSWILMERVATWRNWGWSIEKRRVCSTIWLRLNGWT